MRSTLSSTVDSRGATNLDSLDAVDSSRRGRGAAVTNQCLVSHFAETRPHLVNLERLESYGAHQVRSLARQRIAGRAAIGRSLQKWRTVFSGVSSGMPFRDDP